MIRSISNQSRSTIEINVEHEMVDGYKKQFIIRTDPQKPFFQFVYQLEEEIFSNSKWQKREFYNNETKIIWKEVKTIQELEIKNLTIKNINRRDQLKTILHQYNTKIASRSLVKNSNLQKDIRNLDNQIAQLLLSPDIEDPFQQQDNILRQQAQFYMKRKFEEDILEDQIQQNQIVPNIENNENDLNLVLNVLSEQLKQGNKQLVLMQNNDSIQSIQLALASSRQKIYEIKLNSKIIQFEDLRQIEKEKAFIQDFVQQICRNYQFNQQNIHVMGLESGSIIVRFIINDILVNSTDLELLLTLYDESQIKIQTKPFFKYIGFSVNNFYRPMNEDWTDEPEILRNFDSKKQRYQNNKNYQITNKYKSTGPDNNPLFTFHPKGWKAYGLNIQDKYENNNWFNDFGVGAWYIVYALICDEDQEKVMEKNLSQIHPERQIFQNKVFSKIELAEKMCNTTRYGQNQYKMIFQCRVFPDKLLVGNQPYKFAFHQDINEFMVDQFENIRVEKILLKNMSGSCQKCPCSGWCAKLTDCFKNSCSCSLI